MLLRVFLDGCNGVGYARFIAACLFAFAIIGAPSLCHSSETADRITRWAEEEQRALQIEKAELDQRYLQAQQALQRAQAALSRAQQANNPRAITISQQAVQTAQQALEHLQAAKQRNLNRIVGIERETQWTGNWDEKEKELVNDALRGLKDGNLRNWITASAQLNRFKDNAFSPLTANGSVLRFKDGFFLGDITVANRENLIAFEAGKVFWNSMKDKRLEDGKTLETWFVSYASEHISVIGDMKAAKHRNEGFSRLGDIDTPSQFGYVFRAQALQLNRPRGQSTQQEWDGVSREFRTRIDPLLRGK